MIESPYTNDAFETKTLFLIENEPGSSNYVEVMFTEEQWAELRKLAISFFKKIEHEPDCDCEKDDDVEPFFMPTSDADAVNLPLFKGSFTQKEIDDSYEEGLRDE